MLFGCKSKQPVIQVPVKTVERKVSTLVPVAIPGDSAMLRAVFECDSLNRLLIKDFNEVKGNKVSSEVGFKNGVLNYRAYFKPDTAYLPSDTIYTEKEIPIIVEVDKVQYRQTKFQIVFFYIGLITAIAAAVWLIIKLKTFKFLK